MNIGLSGMNAAVRDRAAARVLLLAAALAAFPVYSEVTVVSVGEVRVVEAQEDTMLDGQWIVAGTIRKTGGGKLTIPGENIWFAEGRLDVVEGQVEITQTTGETAPFDASGPMAKSVFWVRAGTNLVFESGELVSWRDVRDAEGGARPYARSYTEFSGGACPTAGTTEDGLPYVYFGGYGSGQMMDWRTADGAQSARYDTVHVFAVYNPLDAHGHFLGTVQNNEQQQHFAVSTGAASDTLFSNVFRGTPNYYDLLRTGRVFVDGVRTIPNAEIRLNQIQLIETEAGRAKPVADAFFTYCNGKKSADAALNAGLMGGGRLHEVLVFTSKLTEAERLLVEAELVRSWVHRGLKGPAAVWICRGAELLTPAGYLAQADVRSEGRVAASSMGETFLPGKGVYGSPVAAVDADVSFRNPALVPVSGVVGKNVTVDREQTTTIVSGAGGCIVKEGIGALPLAPLGNAEVHVNAGRLSLATRKESLPRGLAGNLLQNGDFEGLTADVVTLTGEGQYFGAWEGLESVCMRFHPWSKAQNFPENGGCFAHIKDVSGFKQSFKVVNEGRYRLSFLAATRNDNYGAEGGVMSVYIDDFLLVRVPMCSKSYWTPCQYLTPTLSAGDHVIAFRHEYTGDRSSALDDISLVYYDDLRSANVPNGGFECLSFGDVGSATPQFSDVNKDTFEDSNNVHGWTASDPSRVWLVRSADALAASGGDRSAMTALFGGAYSLVLRYGAQIETTFTVPTAGVYRVEGDFAKAGMWTGDQSDLLLDQADIPFTLTVNGRVENRSTSAFSFEHQVCDRRFRLEGGDSVTLRISLPNSVGHRIVINDISFVADEDDSANLLDNPSFAVYDKTAVGWAAESWEFQKRGNVSASSVVITKVDDANFGRSRIDGDVYLRVRGIDTTTGVGDAVWQSVTFPEAGAYMFSFWARSRTNLDGTQFSYGPSGLRALLVAGSETNVLGVVSESEVGLAFRKYMFSFNIPTAGLVAKVGVAATTVGDKTTMVDAFSLAKVGQEDGYVPVTKNTSMEIASSASLSLDYNGVFKFGDLRINRKRFSGYVDSRTDGVGDSLVGSGALTARFPGLWLYVR